MTFAEYKEYRKQVDIDLHINYLQDVYMWYIQEELRKDALKKYPQLYTEYDKVMAKKGVLVLMSKDKKGEPYIVMTYTMFRSIIEKCNKLIIKTVLKGEKFHFGKCLGHIQGSRIDRNFKKRIINMKETKKLRKETGDETVKVYHTSDTYCRIAWKKLKMLKNVPVYEFKPCTGFRQLFSRTLIENPLLQFKFSYYQR